MGLFSTLFQSNDPMQIAKKLMAGSRAGNFDVVKQIVLRENEKGIMRPGVKDMFALGLFEAAAEGHFKIAVLLADYGAALDRPHAADGSTAMGIAAFGGHDSIVQFLTRRAANVNARNNSGVTPFMLAAARCSAETVSRMIDAGADLHAASDDGLTARDFASMPPREDILELLRSAPDSGINVRRKELGLTAPFVKGGVCAATYDSTGYVMKAFTDLQSVGPIKYLYVLEVTRAGADMPIIYVTAECNDLTPGSSPVLGLFDEAGHHNFGHRPGIEQLHMFIANARLMALEHIGRET